MKDFVERKWDSESRMRENRLSGLMRGGKQTVIGPRAFQSVTSRLLYNFPHGGQICSSFVSDMPGTY